MNEPYVVLVISRGGVGYTAERGGRRVITLGHIASVQGALLITGDGETLVWHR